MTRRNLVPGGTKAALAGAAAIAILLLGGCAMLMRGTGVEPPPASEFGYGPRRSAGGLYEATLEPVAPLRTRKLQTVRLTLRTAAHAPLDGASVLVDGGMPQHGHGLPTTPRVTRRLDVGTYQVDGLKFNMGGWWELKFRIEAPAGTDSVTFNLDL